jgi:hypothetical protein
MYHRKEKTFVAFCSLNRQFFCGVRADVRRGYATARVQLPSVDTVEPSVITQSKVTATPCLASDRPITEQEFNSATMTRISRLSPCFSARMWVFPP